MTTNRRTAGPGSCLRTTGGYSLVEMMIAMAFSKCFIHYFNAI